ncbi:hypothetical protein P7K49_010765 [Saguinus oedipus]|uniref:Uncharacterized protein n=1 Tax=Saguinus oedipus TaxID=9490 RepID=A0ABQ9VNS3_SAGOE|nr:hypothetical protein P7K49_010765 [Saguinus oedipus]
MLSKPAMEILEKVAQPVAHWRDPSRADGTVTSQGPREEHTPVSAWPQRAGPDVTEPSQPRGSLETESQAESESNENVLQDLAIRYTKGTRLAQLVASARISAPQSCASPAPVSGSTALGTVEAAEPWAIVPGVEQKNYYVCVPLGLIGNCTVTSSGI